MIGKYCGESIPQPHPKKACEVCLCTNWPHGLKTRPKVTKNKKRFASLRFCVSSLHRDHARMSLYCKEAYNLLCIVKQSSLHCEPNLLCIVKRLFNAWAETQALKIAIFGYINIKRSTIFVPFRFSRSGVRTN